MKIAMTGPTGSIGSELVEELVNEGHEVTAIVRPGSDRISNIQASDSVSVIECDISDYKSLYGKEKCDLFYHLAWAGTTVSSRNDAKNQSNNIQYALDAALLAKNWGAKKFIGAGSQAEYGPSNSPLSSSTPIRPISAYGVAKYAAGRLCGTYCKNNEVEFNWTRILSTYGKNDASNTLIMYLIRTMKEGTSPQLTSCEQTWDYIYSKDCAKALIAIGCKGIDGKTYCIGSGSRRKLKDYVEDIRTLIDQKLEISYGAIDYYPDQPMMLCADISELTQDTGFVPHTTFKDGVRQIISDLYPDDSA